MCKLRRLPRINYIECETVVLSVSEVLDFEIIRRAEPKILAGAGALDRQVRWVHVADIADIAKLLHGGELILTTGLGIRDSDVQRRYVRDIAAAGVAGVILGLGRSFHEAPKAMAEEAERCGLPLIILGLECPFVDITEQVHTRIINRQFDLLTRAENMGHEFTDLVLKGEGIPRIVRHLAHEVQGPVVLEDVVHQVIEFEPGSRPSAEILEGWQVHSRTGHHDEATGVHNESGEVNCAWIVIPFHGEPWGRLHALDASNAEAELTNLILGQAAGAIALALMADRDAAHVVDRARGALLTAVRRGVYESGNEILERARSLGSDFHGQSLAALIVKVPGLPDVVAERELSESDRYQLRMRLLLTVRNAVEAEGCTSMSSIAGDDVEGIVGVPQHRDRPQALRAIAKQVSQVVSRDFEGMKTVIGAASAATPENLLNAFDNAALSAQYGTRISASEAFYYHDEVGLDYLLLHLADGPYLARFVEAELATLLDHDAVTPQPLLPTLRAYLENGMQKAATARVLFVDRRTLYYRLDRIGRVLERDLEDREVQARLLFALRGLDLLQTGSHRGTGGRPVVARRPRKR
jgi:purine catabolism regulator